MRPKFFPHVEATARAAGADDILAQAVIVETLDAALADCTLILGTSARIRQLPAPMLDAREAANKVVAAESKNCEIALVFGRENNGLNNEELLRCHYHICIPTNPDFSSLNVASAVQIVAYEIKMAFCASKNISRAPEPLKQDTLATAAETEFFYQHLDTVMHEIEFFNEKTSHHLTERIRRLFNRTHLETKEVNILRGILTAVQKKLRV